jgi:xylitol oxidase
MNPPATNWAGNVTFQARQIHRPSSVDELCEVVAASDRLRPLGTTHSFNDIADTTADQVSVAGLPPEIDIDSARATVRVAGGLRYGEVAAHLHRAGWAWANLGSLPHISVAGACATGTHGSGDGNGNLATAVVALDLVTAAGEPVSVDDPRGAAVGLGALGVVTHLTLRVVPTFEVAQVVYDGMALPTSDAEFNEVFSAGYSVSLFTDWAGRSPNQLWLKRLAEKAGPWPAPWLGAVPADGPRHPVARMPTGHCTQQLGVPGPWYERLPHFRLEFTPSAGDELQSEYVVAREHAVAALAAVHEIRDRVAAVLHISELRTIAADELWLSPSYQQDSLAIHFTWVKDPVAVAPVMAEVERRLAPWRPRPHWGKLFATPPADLRERYPRFNDFADLVRRLDPTGKFRNAWLDALLPARAGS